MINVEDSFLVGFVVGSLVVLIVVIVCLFEGTVVLTVVEMSLVLVPFVANSLSLRARFRMRATGSGSDAWKYIRSSNCLRLRLSKSPKKCRLCHLLSKFQILISRS